MKKTLTTLSIAFIVFISFGFIVLQNPGKKDIELEKVPNIGVETELDLMEETNDEEW